MVHTATGTGTGTGTATGTGLPGKQARARRGIKDLPRQGGMPHSSKGPTWRERLADIDLTPSNSLGPKPRAYSYLRFSTPEQLKGDSVRRQSTAAVKYAADNGLELDTELTFEDLGVSAYRGLNSEDGQLGAFLEAVTAGAVPRGSYLLVENLDRLSRQTARKAMRTLESIVDEGGTLVTLNDNRAYTADALNDDPTALLMSILVFMRANEESATKSKRGRAAWFGKRIKAKDSGVPLTSKSPAWLRFNNDTQSFDVIPDRAALVQEIYQRCAAGEGQNTIAQSLNQRCEATWGGGAQWHVSYIAKILSNPAVIGVMIPRSVDYADGHKRSVPHDPIEGYYPAVVDRELYSRIQAIRSRPSAHRGPSSKSIQNILAGLARCPKCDGTMTRVTKGSRSKAGSPYLVCVSAKTGGGCSYKAVKYGSIEDAIIRNASAIFEYAPIGDKGGELDTQIESLDNAIDAKEDAIRLILDFIEGGGEVTPATRTELAKLEAEHSEFEDRYNGLIDRADLINTKVVDMRFEELEDALTEEPINRQRINVALRTLVDNVVVEYDGGELIFNWRHGGETRIGYAWPEGDA